MMPFGETNPAWRPLCDRFWEKVNKNGPIVRKELGRCWIWTGARARYGTTWVNGRYELAHRTAWFLETGKWPEPCALHKCDNTLCVRFSHLFEGTQQKNVDDREAKGRNQPPRGEKHWCAKLTEEKVQQIRSMLKEGLSQRHIGRIFGVAHITVGRVGKGQSWKEVTL